MPAFDEERSSARPFGHPEFVDRIYVVDDASRDRPAAARAASARRASRSSGTSTTPGRGGDRDRLPAGIEEEIDVTCVMAADNQMDPAELQPLVGAKSPDGEVEYAKANRLDSGEAWKVIPRTRYLGNAVLSLLTKIASGYWHVADSQAGYTALSLEPCDGSISLICTALRLPQRHARPPERAERACCDVLSRLIYDVGERSGSSCPVVPRISWLLLKGFWWRMGQKYVIRDFHPLVFFYALGSLMLSVGFELGLVELVLRIAGNAITPATDRPRGRAAHRRLQMTLFAMWFDMEANKELR